MQIINYYGQNFVATVPPQQVPAPVIPSPLLIPPGVYSYNGKAYDMTVEGLYRFVHCPTPAEPWSDGGHRIVTSGDPDKLMGALAGVTVHGTADESLSDAQRSHHARTGWLRMRCGSIDQWARARLTQCGMTHRSVSLVTMETPNGYDEGHVATEVLVGGSWRLYDLDNNRAFRGADQSYMSARDVQQIMDGAYTSEMISPTAAPHNTEPTVNALYMAMIHEAAPGIEGWTRRIFQAVGIWHTDNLCYFRIPAGYEGRKSWLLSLSPSYRVIDDHAAWTAMFYGAGG